MIKPIIEGIGKVFLDPVLEYFMLIELEDDEEIVQLKSKGLE